MQDGTNRSEIMRTRSPILLAAVLLSSAAFTVPASAQSEAEINVRVTRLEDQIRQLVGQVEQLSYEVQQLRNGLGSQPSGQPLRKKTSSAQPPVLAAGEESVQAAELPQPRKTQANQAQPDQGIEQIEEPSNEVMTTVIDENGNEQQVPVQKAPGPRILGTLPGSSDSGGGGFQGQVLVAPGGQPVTETQTVAIQQESDLDSPEALYERSYESLLRRQFGDAESGFQTFVSKHRDHSLAGNAQYWLGETYYVQGDYKQAAQAFLSGYQNFPKSRKAADSLLKLGLSLKRLGQNEQACAAFNAVSENYPKATEARKRAQSESKRDGC
jgi:tol-pal system protein YbgF